MTSFPFLLPPSWMHHLSDELKKPYMLQLAAFVERERRAFPGDIFPSSDELFSAFVCTPFDQVRAVIIGQDPYHGQGQAHGLSFSVQPGVKVPPSLQNIYKELESDLNIAPPKGGTLLSWAKNGVLMLNAILSVRKGEPLSHKGMGWEKFTDAVVEKLITEKEHLVFLLWGKSAQEKFCKFDAQLQSRHLVLQAPHPSPYSAHQGFLGCGHFSKASQYLQQHGMNPIDWSLAP